MKKKIGFDSKFIKNVRISDKPYPIFKNFKTDIDNFLGEIDLEKTSQTELEIKDVRFVHENLNESFDENKLEFQSSIEILETSPDGKIILDCKLISVFITLKP